MMHVYICMYDCVCEFRCIKSEAYLGCQSLLSAFLETRSLCCPLLRTPGLLAHKLLRPALSQLA